MKRKAQLWLFGILMIVGGIITTFLYYIEHRNWLTGQVISYEFPLLPYGFAMAVIGVVLVVIGIIIREEKQTSIVPLTQPPPPPSPANAQVPKKYCRYCGAENRNDAIYCEKCGKKIS